MLGPSGCGKTTTLRMIAGFEEPDRGRILLRGPGRHVRPIGQAQRQHGVPELRPVPAHDRGRQHRVRPEDQEVSRRSEISTRVAEAILRRRPLEGMEDRRPGAALGGQQQRVALARALVNEPPRCCWTSRWARSI